MVDDTALPEVSRHSDEWTSITVPESRPNRRTTSSPNRSKSLENAIRRNRTDWQSHLVLDAKSMNRSPQSRLGSVRLVNCSNNENLQNSLSRGFPETSRSPIVTRCPGSTTANSCDPQAIHDSDRSNSRLEVVDEYGPAPNGRPNARNENEENDTNRTTRTTTSRRAGRRNHGNRNENLLGRSLTLNHFSKTCLTWSTA